MRFILSLQLLILISSFCNGQDTLVFKTGERVGVFILSVKDGKVIYAMPQLDKHESLSQSKLDSLIYEDGTRLAIQQVGAKQDNNDMPNQLNVGQILISSAFGYPVFNSFYSPFMVSQNKFVNFFPSIGLMMEKAYGRHYTISAGITYANFTVEPRRFAFTTTTYSITNIEIRYSYFFIIHKKMEAYYGLAFSYSVINEVVHFKSGNVSDNPELIPFSFYIGFRWYLSKVFAINAEGEIGEPYLAEVGVSFKINARKSSPAPAPQDNYGGHEGK